MKIHAPGKLILSGEHAVVYGKPAIAMAINRYATAQMTRELLPQILFDLSDLAYRSRLSFTALHALKARIKNKYRRFVRGDAGIREVLGQPSELAQVALSIFTEAHNINLPHGVRVHLRSDLPIGAGLGSSAATILSVMYAASHYFSIPISKDDIFQFALQAENLQHGNSSGLDLRVIMQGGCLFMHGEELQSRDVPAFQMYLVNTGSPVSSTGECVEQVAKHFTSGELGDEFANVTMMLDRSLQRHDYSLALEAIMLNHELLCRIGTVPEKVKRFVKEVEKMDGAAKVCGAGTVLGEQAGAVLVVCEDSVALSSLCTRFAYPLFPILAETRGVHVV